MSHAMQHRRPGMRRIADWQARQLATQLKSPPARGKVQDSQGAVDVALCGDQGGPGVEAHVGRPLYKLAVLEPAQHAAIGKQGQRC
jgi:hypothetical protein